LHFLLWLAFSITEQKNTAMDNQENMTKREPAIGSMVGLRH
jgi:hypothetical protein